MIGLEGKTAFVFGVASEDSIAWAICQQLAAAGVTLYLGVPEAIHEQGVQTQR